MVGSDEGSRAKATLKIRKLLISLNAKNAKNTEFAQVRYTAGTRPEMNFTAGLADPANMGRKGCVAAMSGDAALL